jgi:hypothetical protein
MDGNDFLVGLVILLLILVIAYLLNVSADLNNFVDSLIGKTVVDTPGVTSTAASPDKLLGPSYVGCYADEGGGSAPGQRGFPTNAGTMSLSQCNNAAKKAGAPYFGMQYWPRSGSTISDKAECWYGVGENNTVLANAKQWGQVNNGSNWKTQCDVFGDQMYGNANSNAIYKTY